MKTRAARRQWRHQVLVLLVGVAMAAAACASSSGPADVGVAEPSEQTSDPSEEQSAELSDSEIDQALTFVVAALDLDEDQEGCFRGQAAASSNSILTDQTALIRVMQICELQVKALRMSISSVESPELADCVLGSLSEQEAAEFYDLVIDMSEADAQDELANLVDSLPNC